MPVGRVVEEASAAPTPAHGRRTRPRVLGVATLCAGLAAGASSTAAGFAIFTARLAGQAPAVLGTTLSVTAPRSLRGRAETPTARHAEAFDPFGWKGQFKDTVQGLLGQIDDDEEPSQLEEKMMREIFDKFDIDKDGVLNLEEFNALQLVTEGPDAVYDQEQLKTLLIIVNPDVEEPEKGMPFDDYRRLYVVRRLRQAYSTDVTRDHVKVFGQGGGVVGEEAAARAEEAILLTEGTPVSIEGLTGAKELNGQEGHVVSPVESETNMIAEGRVIVKLSDGERVALKPVNIKKLA